MGKAYKVEDWRDTDRTDWTGEIISEGFIKELGWVEYSYRLGAIKINGEWTSNWE